MDSMRRVSKKQGGARPGSGRPRGTGKYREGTAVIRVPFSLRSKIEGIIAQRGLSPSLEGQELETQPRLGSIPLYSTRIAAGYPSQADDHVDAYINVNDYLIHHPEKTFCVRVSGDSMKDAGINDQDLLIVDQSMEATHGSIVIAVLNAELTVKRLEVSAGQLRLVPDNPAYVPIVITEAMDFRILGVALHVIHALA